MRVGCVEAARSRARKHSSNPPVLPRRMAKTGFRPALAASTDPTPVWKVARPRASRSGLEAGGTRPMVRRNAVRSDVVVKRTGAAARAIAGTAVAAWLLAASGAGAATVEEVRVGTHDDGHTRIVVELDSMAGYRLQSPTAGGAPELIVDLDASSISRDVPSKSRVVKKVHVEPSADGSTVRISLATGDVAVKEMLLANPPRIVLDLKARGPIPKSTDVAEAAPAEPAKSEPEPTPEKVAVIPPPAPTPTPTPAKVEAPKSEPVVVAAAEPAAEKTPALKERAAIPPASSPSKVTMPSAPAPQLADDAMPPPPTAPKPELEPAPAAAAAPAAPAPKTTLIPPVEREKRVATTPPSSASPEARRESIAAKAQAKNTGGDSLIDMAMSPVGLGAIGAVVLLLAIVVLRRRRSNEDEDPLYTVMSADDAGAAVSMDDAYPATEARPPVLSSLGPYEPDAYEDASEPVFKPDATGQQMTLGSVPVVEVAVPETPMLGPDDSDSDSIFASEPEPEPVIAAAPPPISIPVPEPIAPMAESPVAQISAEVERRVAELERRLEQLTEARERLERQVAAQTEELRVQRAAIARTQRVVRTIAKTEDMATEPVPRAPTA